MKTLRWISMILVLLVAPVVAYGQDAQQEIQAKTKKFTEAIVSKDLSVLDQVFEKDADNIYYDINEGPLSGFDHLKRVWTAATTNYSITRFDFNDDMKIIVKGDNAVQTGTWTQTQANRSGQSRDIKGRATVLWRKRDGQWRVWHYHASITPARTPRPPQ
ncbi:MAG TPA: nuclear transport factor 2 family protein [Blastocatellia bacterium]|nr:nuclear transport factor 2 family protein [Blastocatellia bacterium]